MKVTKFRSIQIKLASPKEILSWSHGEVLKPETINYRTLKPEKDGLFCERIFGPSKDYQCYCGKYRGIRYKGIVCDRCGVEIASSEGRRERMGHIKLATPVSHIWFLRGVPSAMGMVLGISRQKLAEVIYFVSYIITIVSERAKEETLEKIDKEYKQKVKLARKKLKGKKDRKELRESLDNLKKAKEVALDEIGQLQRFNVLSETDYRKLSLKYGEVFEAKTGAEALYEIFKEIDLKKEIARLTQELKNASSLARINIVRSLKFFQGMLNASIRPEWMFLTILPVLPPGLRPMVQLDGGRYASSDLNDLYRRVINRNNRLKYLLEISAPEVIVRNEKRMLQESVDALIDNGMRLNTVTRAATGGKRSLKSLADMLKGKRGRFRRNLLGKRVDYSARGVIVVGPELKIHNVGVPKEMALEIYKPFVIKKLLEEELAYNIRNASSLIEKQTDEVWTALEEIIEDKPVLLNRAPTLHRISIQAFYPILTEGKAIRISPLICPAYNADFDGDQMAIHLPLSEEARSEAKDIMLSSLNLLKPANGYPIVNPSQDIVMGCYWMSRLKNGAKGEGMVFSTLYEAVLAYEAGDTDLRAKIKIPLNNKKIADSKDVKGAFIETTVGRILFNDALPEEFPFKNDLLDADKLSEITWEIIQRYGEEKAAEIIDKVKDLGFEQATLSGISLGLDDFIVPTEKEGVLREADKKIEYIDGLYKKGLISDKEKYSQTVETWATAKSQIKEILPQKMSPDSPISIIADSGCRGSWVQPVQMAGMRGLMVNPAGKIIELPVKNSFKEGLDVLEYFISTHGARKGISDKALGTSKAGYLTRRLVDVAHDVIVKMEDCGDKKGIVISLKEAELIGQNIASKIVGRVSLDNIKDSSGGTIVKKGEVIDWEKSKKIKKAGIGEVKIRSPLSCQALNGVCQKCYGWDLGRNRLVEIGEAVGVIAAQSIGEPGTQLTMRTFHTGGIAGGVDITQGLPRIEEIFERRKPKGQATISKAKGTVIEVKKDLVRINSLVKKKKEKLEILEYRIPKRLGILVKKGDKVEKGQPLCEGSIDLQQLFRLRGKEYTSRYILQEAQKIYVSQGVSIHDKHIEIIISQMFSRLKVEDPGDSFFIPGEVVEKPCFIKENEELKKRKKRLAKAKPMLLGISSVALSSDSFLSSASFQQTSRVLIKAALEGKEDKLSGLKENVIIGKLIPAGTGFEKP